MNPLRRQPPAYSPLSARSIALALVRAMDPRADPGAHLGDLLKHRFEAGEAVLFGSGTQALTSAIRAACRSGRGDAVALPGYACFDLATAAVGADARVALYDLDPATLGPDWSSLEKVLQAGVRVVVLAPLYGVPIDWRVAEDLGRRHGALLIEDAAQGSGALWDGTPLGSLGDLSVLSFGRGKGWTGSGGGALLARGDSVPLIPKPPSPATGSSAGAALRALAQWLLSSPSIYGIPRAIPWVRLGETIYHDPAEPTSISRFSAALALATDAPSREEAAARSSAGEALLQSGAVHLGVTPAILDEACPGYLRFPVLLPPSRRANALRSLARFGVEPGYPTTLADLPVIRQRLFGRPAPLPGAEILAGGLVTLPTHSLTTGHDRGAIAASGAALLH